MRVAFGLLVRQVARIMTRTNMSAHNTLRSGNGGNIGHRVPLARVFLLKLRCNVLMLSYRGYVAVLCTGLAH